MLISTENNSFDSNFAKLTGYVPFIWQSRLFHDYFLKGNLPSALDIPTGLGKTSVIAVWYLALKQRPDLPRRIVYVVDRRAVVDQATTVAENIKTKSGDENLNVSTLRGKLLDNRNWLSNPAAPAIIVGTIDMIGSRLLFSGYGVSRKMRSYHAGLLGTDALIVLDESHLAPAFEKLLQTIESRTKSKGTYTFGPLADAERNIIRPLRLISLSATGKYDAPEEFTEVFQLSNDDKKDCSIKKRLSAYKRLIIQECDDSSIEKNLFELLAEQAWKISVRSGPSRIIVYCDLRDDAIKVKKEIDKKIRQKYGRKNRKIMSELLVGGRRILEREKITIWLKDTGFNDGGVKELEHSVFLIATAAGEVGIDLDADHMVCDLVEWERIVQRLGRVNRRGIKESDIYVVAAPRKNLKQDDLLRLRTPLDMLRFLESNNGHDASSDSILDLKARATVDSKIRRSLEQAGKTITLRPALTRALLDAWSFTSLKNYVGRPSNIQPWLRGWEDNQKPTTIVVWRKYLPVHTNLSYKEIEAFFDAAAPHISETLETETYRVCEWLTRSVRTRFQPKQTLSAKETPQCNSDDQIKPLYKQDVIAYILSSTRDLVKIRERNCVKIRGCDLEDKKFVDKLKEEYLPNSTLVLDARFGGLSDDGMLASSEKKMPRVIDNGSEWISDQYGIPIVRFRVKQIVSESTTEIENGWHDRLRLELNDSEDEETKEWLVVEKLLDDAETEDDRATAPFQELDEHHAWTEQKARCIATSLGLPDTYVNVLAISARLHDEGKRHKRWQQAFNAPNDDKIYAKTKGPINVRLLDNYRHEFGSLSYVEQNSDFQMLDEDLQDLVLHLVVSHHGWGRPVVSTQGCDEPPSSLQRRAYDVILRFERLQKQWGPWGLAWWEVLLRSADQQASLENCKRQYASNNE